MADTSKDTKQHRDIMDIVRDMLPDIGANKIAEFLTHPQAQDVIDAAGQAAAKEAGIDTIAHPDNSSQPDTSAQPTNNEDLIRNQQISDMATAVSNASAAPPSQATSKDMIPGVIDILLNSANNAIDGIHNYAKDITSIVKTGNITKDTK